MLSLSFVWIVVCVFMCCGGLVRTDSVDDGYSGEVKTYLEDLIAYYMQYEAPVQKAYNKMNQFTTKPYDTRYAIALINLYTQNTSFYVTLNEEMRSGNPTGIWRRGGDLMNRGLDMLDMKQHEITYRGCTKLDKTPKAGEEYRFNQFTSTSLSKKIGEIFAQCGFLFIIKNVYGVLIKEYSAFPEREILLKSTELFYVTKGPISAGRYKEYYLDGSGNVSGCDKAINVNWKTISVLAVLILMFN